MGFPVHRCPLGSPVHRCHLESSVHSNLQSDACMAYDRSRVSAHFVSPPRAPFFPADRFVVFDNALQGTVAGVLDNNYETRTRFRSFLCTCVFYTCGWFVIRTVPALFLYRQVFAAQKQLRCRLNHGVDLITVQDQSQCGLNLSAEAVRLNSLAESIAVQNQWQL